MKTLRQYIDRHKPRLTHEEWADRLGISRSYFTEILNGSKPASRRVMAAVNDMTGGKVPPNVWFAVKPENRPDPAPTPAPVTIEGDQGRA